MDDHAVLTMAQTLEQETIRLNGELRTIANDTEITAQKQRRYGDVFLAPLQYLQQLRQHKELRLTEIASQLQALQAQLDNSAQLLSILQNQGRTATIVKPSQPGSVSLPYSPSSRVGAGTNTSMSPGRRIV